MAARRIAAAATFLAVAVLAATVFFFHLGSYGLWEPDEARYAEISREMLASRDFILPHLNYVAYIEKPPLLYWLTAFSFAIGGRSELAARIVPALSALVGVIATWLFAARVFDYRRATLAAAVLATAPLYAVMAQVLTTDLLLTACVTVSLFAFFLARREGGGWRWLFYAAMGLGTLTKGPVAIVTPALACLAFLAWRGELRGSIAKFRPLSGLLLTSAIAAPWFVAVTVREPDFPGFYFFGEHIRRFFQPGFSHGEPFYFYLPVLILGFLPWSILAPIVGARTTANRDARDFCAIAATATLVFFSLASGKLIPYILPAFPPLAVVIADMMPGAETPEGESAQAATRRRGRFMVAAPIVLASIGVASLAAAIAAPSLATPYALLVRPALTGVGLISIAGAIAGCLPFARRRGDRALAIVVITMAAAILAGSYARREAEPIRSYAALSRAVAVRAPEATLICYHRYVQSLAFYTGQRVVLVGPPSELRFGMEHSADRGRYFLNSDDDLIRLWKAPGAETLVLVIDEPELQRLRARLGEFATIASEGQKRAILREGGQGGNS